MSANFQLKKGVHVAITLGAASGFLFASRAIAAEQQQSAPAAGTVVAAAPAAQLKAIEVTGTKIRSTDVEQAQPIEVINAAQIKASGLVTVGDVLQQITSSGAALNSLANDSGNFKYVSSGASNIDLRFLGAARTLVLVNGHRWATAIDGTVNLDTIPASIIDHVEILQDGASAIYGSEAIAGVVNIITVKNFQGAEANAYLGMHNGDGHWNGLTTNDNVTIGTQSAHSGLVLNASYMNQNGILGADTDITSIPVWGTGLTRGSGNIPQGRWRFIAPYSGSPSSPTNVVAPSTGLTAAECPVSNFGTASAPNYLPHCDIMTIPGTPGTSPADFESYSPADAFNYAPFNYAQTPLQTTGIYMAAHYDLADNLSFKLTTSGSHRVSNQQAAPNVLIIGAGSAVSFMPGEQYYPFNFSLNTHAALGPGLLQGYGGRTVAQGLRLYQETENMIYMNPEADGFFDVGSSEWDWDIGYAFSKDDTLATNTGVTNGSNLQIQLNPAQCAAAASSGCVPVNLFGGLTAPMTPEQVAFFKYTGQNSFTTSMQNAYFDITNSDIATLPAGPLGFAAGYQRIGDSGAYQPDAEVVHPTNGAIPILPTSGSTSDEAVYTEFNIPLLAGMPFARSVNLDVASRYTRNSVLSTTKSNTSSRAGIKWEANHDLLLRASWSQGFRTPNVSDLFAGLTSTIPTAFDPCNNYLTSGVSAATQQRCRAAGVAPAYSQESTQVQGFISGNPDLKPETSISKTIGIVYSPGWLPGFNGNLDYYHIKIVNAIQPDTVQDILNDCYVDGVTRDCALITRYNNGIGDIKELLDPTTNIGGTITSGFDFALTYSLPTTSLGQFTVGLQGTYINEYTEFLPSPTGVGFSYSSLLGVERGGQVFPFGMPRWKANAQVTWAGGNWQAAWKLFYIGSTVEACSDFLNGTPVSLANLGACSNPNFQNNALSTNYLGRVVYNDAHVSYALDSLNTTLTFGINNVFDKQPATSNIVSLNSFDPTLYRVPGRFYYASIGVKF